MDDRDNYLYVVFGFRSMVPSDTLYSSCRVKTVFAPATVILITITVDRGGKTLKISFSLLNSPDEISLGHTARTNPPRFGNFSNFLQVHVQTPQYIPAIPAVMDCLLRSL